MPFITGTNLDEGAGLFVSDIEEIKLTLGPGTFFPPQRSMTDQDIKEYVVGVTSNRNGSQVAIERVLDGVLNLYSTDPKQGSPYGSGDELFGLPPSYKRVASILGDLAFDGPRRLFLQTAIRQGVKSNSYQFTQPQPAEPALGGTWAPLLSSTLLR